jgi:hypothetical protein
LFEKRTGVCTAGPTDLEKSEGVLKSFSVVTVSNGGGEKDGISVENNESEPCGLREGVACAGDKGFDWIPGMAILVSLPEAALRVKRGLAVRRFFLVARRRLVFLSLLDGETMLR